jgi:cytochrome c553
MKIFSLTLILLLAAGCSEGARQYENYELRTTADITLQASNHPHGYGRVQCFSCHNQDNIHQVNRINAPSFDLAKPLVEQSGLESCAGCHGRNGVP